MSFIDQIIERAKSNKKNIVIPESMDKRVLKAVEMTLALGIANITVIGNVNEMMKIDNSIDYKNWNIIDPNNSDLTEGFINQLYELRKEKGMTIEEASKLLHEDYMYYACMLVKNKMADGVVSGACHSTSNTLRPALQIIKTAPDTSLVSSFFLMVVPNCDYGDNGTFVFSDCGLVQNPDSESLACIAKSSADSFNLLVEKEPIVALLSHSTKGSAKHEMIDKVTNALAICKEKYSTYKIDGELQLDAAIVPEVAKTKAPGSSVAGRANVLIFPELDAGNIGYKLVQRLAKAEAYGPITQGIAAPINDLSRGCSSEDIVGVIAITAVQAQSKK